MLYDEDNENEFEEDFGLPEDEESYKGFKEDNADFGEIDSVSDPLESSDPLEADADYLDNDDYQSPESSGSDYTSDTPVGAEQPQSLSTDDLIALYQSDLTQTEDEQATVPTGAEQPQDSEGLQGISDEELIALYQSDLTGQKEREEENVPQLELEDAASVSGYEDPVYAHERALRNAMKLSGLQENAEASGEDLVEQSIKKEQEYRNENYYKNLFLEYETEAANANTEQEWKDAMTKVVNLRLAQEEDNNIISTGLPSDEMYEYGVDRREKNYIPSFDAFVQLKAGYLEGALYATTFFDKQGDNESVNRLQADYLSLFNDEADLTEEGLAVAQGIARLVGASGDESLAESLGSDVESLEKFKAAEDPEAAEKIVLAVANFYRLSTTARQAFERAQRNDNWENLKGLSLDDAVNARAYGIADRRRSENVLEEAMPSFVNNLADQLNPIIKDYKWDEDLLRFWHDYNPFGKSDEELAAQRAQIDRSIIHTLLEGFTYNERGDLVLTPDAQKKLSGFGLADFNGDADANAPLLFTEKSALNWIDPKMRGSILFNAAEIDAKCSEYGVTREAFLKSFQMSMGRRLTANAAFARGGSLATERIDIDENGNRKRVFGANLGASSTSLYDEANIKAAEEYIRSRGGTEDDVKNFHDERLELLGNGMREREFEDHIKHATGFADWWKKVQIDKKDLTTDEQKDFALTYWGENQGTLDAAWQWGKETGSLIIGGASTMAGQALKAVVSTPEFLLSANAQVAQACFEAMGFASAARTFEDVNDFAVRMYDSVDKNNVVSSTLNEWGGDLTEAGSRFDEEQGKIYGATKGLAVFAADVMVAGGVGGVAKAGAQAAIRQAAAASARGATKLSMTQLVGKKLMESAFQKTVKSKGFQTSITKTAKELGLDEVAALENTTKYLAALDLSAIAKEYGEYVSRGLAKTAGKDLPNNLTTAFANTAVQDIVFKALPRTAEQLAASKAVTGYFVGKAGADYISGFEEQKTEEAIDFYCTTHGIKREDYEKTVDEETRDDLERKARSRAFMSGYLGAAAAMAVSFYCNFKLEEHVSVIGKKLGSGVEKRLASGVGSMPMAATDATFKRLYGGFGTTVGDMLEALTSRGLSRSASILVASRIMGTTLANTLRSGTSEAINEVTDGLTSYFITTLGQKGVESLDAAEAISQVLEGGILGFLGGSISHNVSFLLPRPKASAESTAKFGRSKNIFLNEQWEKINKAGQAGQDLITKRQTAVRNQIRNLETQIRNGENTEENSKAVTRLKAVEAELGGLHWTDVTPMKIARLFDGDDTVAQKLLDLQRAANKAGLRYIAMTAQSEAEDRANGLKHWLKKNAGTPIAALYEAQWNALNVENIETQRELGVFGEVPQTLDGIEETLERMQELIQRDAERKDQLVAKGELTEAEQHELDQINTIQVAAEKYAEYLTSKQRTLSEAERARLDEENTRISEAETGAGKAAEKASLLGKRIDDNNKTISKLEKQNADARQRKEAIQSEIAELESELGVATDETVRETLTQRISEKQGEIVEIDAAIPGTAETLATLRENNNKLYADYLAATRTTALLNQRASKLASSNYRLLANLETVVNKTSSDLKEAQKALEGIRYELDSVVGRTEEEETALRSREEEALKKLDEARAAMQDIQDLYLKNADPGLLTDIARVGIEVSKHAEDVDGNMTLASSNPFADGTQAHLLYDTIVREVQKRAKGKKARGVRINALTDRLIKASGLESSSKGIVKDCVVTPVLKAFESAGLIQYKGKDTFVVNPKAVEHPAIPESPAQLHAPDFIPAATITAENARTVDAWTPVGNSVSVPKTTQAKPSGNPGEVRRRIEEATEADAQQPHVSYETIMRNQLRNRSPRFDEESEGTFNQLFDKVVSLLITESGVSSVREQDISNFIEGMDVDAETKQKLASEYLNEIVYALGLEKQGDVYKVRLTSENEAEFAEAISKLEKMHGKAFNPLANANTMRAFSQSVDDAREKVSDEMLEEIQALGMATDGSYTSLSDFRFIEAMRKVYGDSPSVDVFDRMCNWLNEAGVLDDVFIRPVINDPLVENGIGGVNFQEGMRNGHHQYVVEINVSKGFNSDGTFLQTLVHEVGHSFFSEVAFKNAKISSALADVAIEARTQILANQQAILAQFRTQFWMLPPDMRYKALTQLENMLYGVGLRLETTTTTNPDGTPKYSFSFSDKNLLGLSEVWQPQEFYTVAISNRMMDWAMKLVGARADAAEQELRDLISGRQFLGLIMGSYDYGENRDEDDRMWNDLLALIDQMSAIERSGDPASAAALEVVARSINKGIKESMSLEERAIVEDASGIGENNIDYGYSYRGGMFNVIGRNAKTWGNYKHTFKGRDDGKDRAEIDSSKAKLNTSTIYKADTMWKDGVKAVDRMRISDRLHIDIRNDSEIKKLVKDVYEAGFVGNSYDGSVSSLYETLTPKAMEAYIGIVKRIDKIVKTIESDEPKFAAVTGNAFSEYARYSLNPFAMNELALSLIGIGRSTPAEVITKIAGTNSFNAETTLGEILDYEELYEAYEDLRDVKVIAAYLGDYTLGYYSPLTNTLAINFANFDYEYNWRNGHAYNVYTERGEAELKSTLLHEIQHLIQRKEGFAEGGNPTSARRETERLFVKPLEKLYQSFLDENGDVISREKIERDVAVESASKQIEKIFDQINEEKRKYGEVKDKKGRVQQIADAISKKAYKMVQSLGRKVLSYSDWSENNLEELLEKDLEKGFDILLWSMPKRQVEIIFPTLAEAYSAWRSTELYGGKERDDYENERGKLAAELAKSLIKVFQGEMDAYDYKNKYLNKLHGRYGMKKPLIQFVDRVEEIGRGSREEIQTIISSLDKDLADINEKIATLYDEAGTIDRTSQEAAAYYDENFLPIENELKEIKDRMDAEKRRINLMTDYDLYRRLAGEIEARAVQKRINMTAEEREARPFNEELEYLGEAITILRERDANELAREVSEKRSSLKREFNEVSGNDLSPAAFNTMARNAGYDTRTTERNINVDTVLKENNGVLEAANGTVVDLRGENPTAMFNIAARHASPTSGIRKMSTGFSERGFGLQAYGFGLYFSSNEDIHKGYAFAAAREVPIITEHKKQDVKFDEKAKLLVGDKYKDGEYEYLLIKDSDIKIPLQLSDLKEVENILQLFRLLGKDTIAALSGEPIIDYNGERITLNELKNEKSAEINRLSEEVSRSENLRSEVGREIEEAQEKRLAVSPELSTKYSDLFMANQKTYADLAALRGDFELLEREEWNKKYDDASVALFFAINPGLAEKVKENYDFYSIRRIDLKDYENATLTKKAAQYEVELNADDSNLLIWDRPVSEQNETAQRLVKVFLEDFKDAESFIPKNANFTGGDFYNAVCREVSQKAASEWFLKKGIKGIKYQLEGLSDIHNYVMFSGDDVQITRYNDATSNYEWTDYYDETANFPREGIRPMFNRVSSQRGGTSSIPITTSHPVFDNLTGRTAKRQMDPPYKPITIGGEAYSYQTLPPNPVFNLIGSRAKTWGKHFDEGRRPFRSQDGKMKMEINADTCVWKTEFVGEDGKTYKYESPWQRVPVIGNLLSWGNFMPAGETFKIADVLDYPELFEAYPHLKDLRVQRSTFLGANGSYDLDANLIQFSSTLSLDTARSVLLHELQHAIQDYEGFASGGDQGNTWRFIIDSMTGDIIKTDLPEDLRLSEEEKAQKLLWMQEDWDNSGDWRAAIRKNITDTRKRLLFQGRDSGGYIYKRLLGEVEARTVQKRRNYTVEQRKEIPFESDYDVALNEIILSFETRYDWLSYFARTKTEENLYRQHVSNVKEEVRNLLDEGKPKTANIVWSRLVAEDKARKQRELFDRDATDVQLVNGVMFNVAGPKSMGFDKNAEGVFEGRDGNLRRELDSSKAKIKDIYVPPSVYTKEYVKEHIEKAIKASKIKDGLSLLDQYRAKYHLAQWFAWQKSGELSSEKYEEYATQQEQLNRELSELSSYEGGGKLSPLAKAAMRLANDELAASGYSRNQMLWKNKEIMDSFIHAIASGTVGAYKRAITSLFGKFRPRGVFTKKLSEVLDYPALYEAYPQIKDLEVRIGDNKVDSGLGKFSAFKEGPYSGWYDSANNYIQLNPLGGGPGISGPLSSKLTLIHEVQHWIQNYEGWPVGNTSALPDDEYWVVPEEVEARTVEMRSLMPENELAELTWLDTYDAEEAYSRNAKSGYHSDLYYEAPEQDRGESQVGFMLNRVDFRDQGPEVAQKMHKELIDTINATADYKNVYPIDREMSPERIFKAIFIGDFQNRQGRAVAQIPNHKIYQATISNGFNKKRFTSSDVTDSFVFALVSALSDAKSQGRKVPEELLNMFNSLKDEDDLQDFKTLIKTFITNPLVEVSGSDAGAAMLGGFSRLIGLNAGLEIRGIDTMEKTVPGIFMHLNEHMVNMQKLLGGSNKRVFSDTLAQRQKGAGVFTRDFHLLSMKAIPARIRKMLGLNWRNVESGESVAAELKNLVRRQELRVDLGVSTIHAFNNRFDRFLEAAQTEQERQERTVLVGDALGSNRALYDKKEFDAIDREYNTALRRVESEFEIVTQNTNDRYSTLISNLRNTRQETRGKYNDDIKRRKRNGASEAEVKKIEEERDRALQEIDDKESLARASQNEEIKRALANRQLQKQAAALEQVNKRNGVRTRIAGEIRATQRAARERLEYMSQSGDAKATEMLQAIDEARKQIDQDMDLRMKNDPEFAEAARGSQGIYLPRLYLASLKGIDESKKRFEAIRESSKGDALFDLRVRVEKRVAENVATKNTEGFYEDWSARLAESAALTNYMKELERSDEDGAQRTKEIIEDLIAKARPFLSDSFSVAKLLTKDKQEIDYYKTFAPQMAYGEGEKTVTGDTFNEAWAKSYVYRLITQPSLARSEVDLAAAIREQEIDKGTLERYSDTIYTAVRDANNWIENSEKNKDIKKYKNEAAAELKSRGTIQLLGRLGLNGAMDMLAEAYKKKHDGESPTQAELVREVAEEIISLSDDGKILNPTGNELLDGWVSQSYSVADSYALMPSTQELLLITDGADGRALTDELRHDTVVDSFLAKLEDYAMSRGYVDGINRKELHDKIVQEVRETNKDYLWNYVESLFFNDDSTDLNTRHDLPQEYMQMLGAQLLDNAESIKDTVHSGVTGGLRESTGIDFYKSFIDIAGNLQDQGFAFTSKPTEKQAAAFGHKASDYVDIGDRKNGWTPKGVSPITSTLYVLNTVVEDAKRVYDAFQNNTDSDSTVIAAEKSQLFSKGLRKIIRTVNAMPLISGFTPTIRNFMGMIPMVVVPTGVNKARLASSAYTAARTCALFLDSITVKSRRAEFFARLDAYKEMGVVETNALYTIRHSDWSTLEEIAVRTKGNLFNSAIEAIEKAQLFMGKVYSLPDSLGKIISYEANFADLCDFKAFKPEYDEAVARANADGITENMIISNHALLKNYMSEETFDTISGTARERMAFEQPSSATTPDWIHSRIPIYKDDSSLIKGWKYALNTFTQINGPFMMFHYNMLRSVIKNFQFGLNDLQEGLRKGDLFGQAWSGVNRIGSGAALLIHPFTTIMVPGNIAQTIFTQVILAIMNAGIDDDEHKWKSVDVDNSALVIDMIDAKLLADYWDTQDGIVICRKNEEGTNQFAVAMTDFVNPYSSYTSTARHIVNAYKTGDWKALQKATRSLLGPLCDHHLFLQRILNADKYVDRRDIALPKDYGHPDIKTSFLGAIGGLAFDDPKFFLDEDARLSQEAAKLASFVGFLSPDLVRRSARVLSSYEKGDDAQRAAYLGIAGFGSIYPKDTVKTLSSRFIKNSNDYREAFFWLERKEKDGTLSEQGKKAIEEGRAIRDKNERQIMRAARALGVEQELRSSVKKSSKKVKRIGLSKEDLKRLRNL